ncbi:hypothetical protein FB451DRAFT_1466459 [Mycena latifolia]|nr:hypothetical protein FB451DRAFT_1466459 [Mycena latifolia]
MMQDHAFSYHRSNSAPYSNPIVNPLTTVTSTVAALSDELERYDADIARLQAQLDRVASERAALQSYYEDCGSLLSPIRRLPSEILVKIFTLFCPDPLPTPLDSTEGTVVDYPGRNEIAYLAQGSLLALSQLHGGLWSTPAQTSKMMALLMNVLERGSLSPLSISILASPAAPYVPALELLAAHSERWRAAYFLCAFDMQPFSSVRGRLPQLRILALCGPTRSLDIFEGAPYLTLEVFGCAEVVGLAELVGRGMSPAIRLMPRLSKTAKFLFQLLPTSHATPFDESTSMPHITAKIAGLSLVVVTGSSSTNVGSTLAKIVESLTLLGLKELGFKAVEYPQLPLPWLHTQFLALAARSSFDTHLQDLDLYHSIIPEAELIQCLGALPSLERLAISNHLSIEVGGGDHLLITDTLLTHLTWTPHSACPVPHLRSLRFQTLLQFDNEVFLSFLLSRLPFSNEILCLPGHRRDLDSGVVTRIDELRFQKSLVFSFT